MPQLRVLPLLLILLALALGWMLWNGGVLQGIFSPNPDDAKTEITLSTWGNADELRTLNGLIKGFEAEHPSVRVDVRHMPEHYTQSLQMLLAASQTPDVMMLNSLDVKRFCVAGTLQNLNTVFSEAALAPFYPNALASLSLPDGTLCAVPRDVSNLVVYVNRDWLATLPEAFRNRVTPFWHLDDLEAVADATVQAEAARAKTSEDAPQRWPLWFYQAPALYWLPMVWSEGGHAFADDALALDASAAQALERYKNWRFKHGWAPGRQHVANTTMTELFLQGRLLFLLSGRWSVPFLRENVNFQWDVLPFPRGEAGSRVGVDASGYALSTETKHPEAARALLEWLSAESALKTWTASGLIIPARRPVAESEAFLQGIQPPAHAEHFLSAIENGVPSPYPAGWPALGQKLNTAMDAYLNAPQLPLAEALAQNGLPPPEAPTESPPITPEAAVKIPEAAKE